MLEVVLYAAVGLYLIGPVIIWLTLSELTPAKIEPLPPEDANELQALRAAAAPLLELGFREIGAFRHQTTAKPSRGLLLLDPAGTSCVLVAMLSNRSFMIEFHSETEDRSALLLTNDAKMVLPIFEHRPGKLVRQFPEADARELYEAHKALAVKQLGRALRPIPQSDQFLAEVSEGEVTQAEYDVSRGWAKLRNGKKRPTLRGAFLMSWRIAWPMSHIRRYMRNKEHRRALQAAQGSG